MEAARVPIHAFLQFFLISAAHNILSINQCCTQYSVQASGCFPHNQRPYNIQQQERNESYHNDFHQSKDKLEIGV